MATKSLSQISPMLQWRFEPATNRMFFLTGGHLCLLMDFTREKPASPACSDCFMPLVWDTVPSKRDGEAMDQIVACVKCGKLHPWLTIEWDDESGGPVNAYTLEEVEQRAQAWLDGSFPDGLFASILAHDLMAVLEAARSTLNAYAEDPSAVE